MNRCEPQLVKYLAKKSEVTYVNMAGLPSCLWLPRVKQLSNIVTCHHAVNVNVMFAPASSKPELLVGIKICNIQSSTA